ncbi:MAG: YqjD family protein [Gammaproteobacteria bacterium]
MRAARERLSGLEEELLDRARDAAQGTEDYVRRNPWQAVGIAAGVGLLLGVLINRR